MSYIKVIIQSNNSRIPRIKSLFIRERKLTFSHLQNIKKTIEILKTINHVTFLYKVFS